MLLNRLIERQRELGLPDREFADALGVPRSTWQLTRTGIKQIGGRIVVAVVKRFPDLRPDVVSFLASDATVITVADTAVANEREVAGVA